MNGSLIKLTSPERGGCWFCYQDYSPICFDVEFDTFVHELCIARALFNQLGHPHDNQEAIIMAYIIEVEWE